ncbi:MAG: nuclear transport factor 2 family protein [Hymenobacter sp.]|nr:MAG: nuclear transport factor 2 family protein [Hymenobacter sp.]
MEYYQDLIRKAYAAFNTRDIPAILTTLHPEVRWSKAWEGDHATGHEEARKYWLRQWQELNPHVEPTGFSERADGRLEVAFHQLVKDKQGQLLFDGPVRHIYTIQDKLLKQMDIEQV